MLLGQTELPSLNTLRHQNSEVFESVALTLIMALFLISHMIGHLTFLILFLSLLNRAKSVNLKACSKDGNIKS